MRKLIQFLINNVFIFIFLILATISMALVVNFNDFQQSVFLTSANGITGKLHQLVNSTTEYFSLKQKNEDLVDENARLSNELAALKSHIINGEIRLDSVVINPEESFSFIPAKVINNTTHKVSNYITLNKGRKDGITNDMGVISDQGIVGIVNAVSDNFSIVISVLNPSIKYSVKFKKNNFNGYLSWGGEDYRYAKLEDISEHVPLQVGDTIVTTGFTSAFTENIPIGVIEKFKKEPGDTFYNIDVKLFTNFKTLSYVKVLKSDFKEEETELENSVEN